MIVGRCRGREKQHRGIRGLGFGDRRCEHPKATRPLNGCAVSSENRCCITLPHALSRHAPATAGVTQEFILILRSPRAGAIAGETGRRSVLAQYSSIGVVIAHCRLDLIATGEQCRIASNRIQEKRLVGLTGCAAKSGLVVEIHLDVPEFHGLTRALGGEPEVNPSSGWMRKARTFGRAIGAASTANRGWGTSLNHNGELGKAARQSLAGAKTEWHAAHRQLSTSSFIATYVSVFEFGSTRGSSR